MSRPAHRGSAKVSYSGNGIGRHDDAGWLERLDRLRRRAGTLAADGAVPEAWPAIEAQGEFARLREIARRLFEPVVEAYDERCGAGYPVLEDNGIAGAGGSLGLRFSRWHAFFVALEHAKRRNKPEPKPAGLAGALDVRVRRMPGDPLPPRDERAPLELVTLALRWDEDRGWVEVRRVLPRAWDEAMIEELLGAYLVGLNYDLVAG